MLWRAGSFAAILLCLLEVQCLPAKTGKSAEEITSTEISTEIKPFGRFLVDPGKGVELISSGVHFGFSFNGFQCLVYASLPSPREHNYLQYELDGVYQGRIRIEGNSLQPLVIKSAKEGKHVIWIYKATEAHTGPIFIQKISGKGIKIIERPKLPLIEFIGNSITCGAAADPSEVPCGTGAYHDQHNAYFSYGPRVARALDANFILSSVSGIGMYRNWNSDGPAMPSVYEKADFQEKSSRFWNFNSYTPDVVSIALGTNDLSRGDGVKKRLPFDSAVFVRNYIQFVQLVKSKYPKSEIAL